MNYSKLLRRFLNDEWIIANILFFVISQSLVFSSVELPVFVEAEVLVVEIKRAISVLEVEEITFSLKSIPRVLFEEDLLDVEHIKLGGNNEIFDPWGNELMIIEKEGGVGVYSLGEDGISKTLGNDPDDINSWNTYKSWRKIYNPPPKKRFTWSSLLNFVKEFFVKNV